ncbi:MAG TPA: septum formation protein Maf [Clostridiales bacterium]|nr:septum formation protein Maf [Clostridiales bacterium]
MYRIILASESPRRKEILKTMGIPFEAMASNVNEEVEEKEPASMVEALAKLKVVDIWKQIKEQNKSQDKIIIIGADTMVFYQGQALGKPKDQEDAARILGMLSNDVHQVYTGVSMIIVDQDRKLKEEHISFAVCTKVSVQPLNKKQMEDYIASGEPMDKAGAYGIQGRFGIHIKEISGDYYNVVGFPIAKIYETLLELGIDLKDQRNS